MDAVSARTGPVGRLHRCDDGSSWGHGLECDAAKYSREEPGTTWRLDLDDGTQMYFEEGQEIPEPWWAKPDPDWD